MIGFFRVRQNHFTVVWLKWIAYFLLDKPQKKYKKIEQPIKQTLKCEIWTND